MALKQQQRLLSVTTPLGPDAVVLTGFEGREELSRLFSFRLDLISDNPGITAADLVGKAVSWTVKKKDESPRHFHGFVRRFMAGDESHGRRDYRIEVVPWLWFLTRTADCRIFQSKSFPDVIEQIFKDLGFSDFETSQIKGAHPKHDYCVQYRETDFNFVSRLMEQEGIFYYFKHEAGKHKLILADQKGAYFDCAEKEVDYPSDYGGRAKDDHLTSWEHEYQFRTGKWAQTDYNFETPSTSLMTNVSSLVSLPGIGKYEVYDYPGEYGKTSDGSPLTQLRMEEEEAGYDVVQAASQCKSFAPGGKFQVRQHRAGAERNKKYVITSVLHWAAEPTSYETGEAIGERTYRNAFRCIPDTVSFRPDRLTPRPIVQGMQTAIVVGPPGEEIHPDKYGRVKVQFHWDREGKKDDKSSCWIRVSQIHAGKGFGAIHLPRIGEEVIVAFLEGDPDQPIIVGRVYHAENMPPFGLPDLKVVSGMKSKTYQGDGYNEYTMNDSPGKELIREHAQFDKDSTVEHDDRQTVHNDRTITVDGKHTETIKKDTTIKITEGDLNHDVVAGTATYHVAKAVQETFEATQKTTVTKKITIESTSDEILIEAATKITLHTGDSKLVMEKDGKITLSGKNIKIVASEDIKEAAPKIAHAGTNETKVGVGNQSVTCDKAQVAVAGAAIVAAAIGKHEITGAIVKIN